MLEKYYKYKLDYNDYIVFIKSGKFYEAIDRDSLIISKLFDYKLTKERMENDLLNMIELAYLANLGVDRENNQLMINTITLILQELM